MRSESKMILVFKTSVRTLADSKKLTGPLGALAHDIRWTFDLEDCDNILRIESDELQTKDVKSLLNKAGFECEELED